ncbi:hypothetical protein WJX81_000775 [Elliptochloris bilobata]|uniref:RRM domain-containing protein n=1 Tax=Elliptochloris bilobata TaxID=381761 RepID=A0AAW1S8V0_9CHLO
MPEGDLKELDPRTVFVRGVAYDLVSDDVERAFSEIGPVRKCFLLQGKGHHKGCGLVSFALPEDAQRAAKELDGSQFGNRAIQVESATRRAPNEVRKERKRKLASEESGAMDAPPAAAAPEQGGTLPKAPHAKRPRTAAQKEAGAGKQRLVRTVALGNLTAVCSASALALARSLGQVEDVVYPMPEGEVAKYMLQRDGCAGQVAFLVYDSVKSALQAVSQLHNRVLEPDRGALRSKKAGASAGTLMWARQVSGEGLHMKKWRLIVRNLAFDVKESQLQELLRPAGFVWELTIPRKPDGRSRGFGFAGFMCRAHAEKAIKVANGQTLSGRTVVADWAVPKAQYAAAAAPLPSEAGGEGGAGDDAGAEGGVAVPAEKAAEVEPEQGAEKRMLQSVVEQLTEPAEARKKPQDRVNAPHATPASPRGASMKQPGMEATAAPSNYLSSKEGSGSGDRMARFGRVKACRLVLDKQTRKPKGTAFVEFEAVAAAQKAADASSKARQGAAPAVMVGGRPMEVDLALSQYAARTLAASKAAFVGGSDNRNLYLAKEGAIEEDSPAWAAMSGADRTKRRRAAAELQTKLKSPNFFVSRTRLCVRNLPYSLDEKQLKELLVAAVKERAEQARPVVKQVKVLRDAEKVNTAGKQASKGLAFVEFGDHAHALCALRQLNNNPAPFGEERRPIVEFAVENAQTLKKRSERSGREAQARRPCGGAGAGGADKRSAR